MASPSKYVLANGTIDYYSLIGVDDDATYDEIKKAYRALAKECHPDKRGQEGHDICILLNEAYQILSDPESRQTYNIKLEQALEDDDSDYSGQPLSKWMPTVNAAMAKNVDPNENRAVFVDEFTCIGCKQCVWCASATFRMENDHGRSRVFAQWLDTEEKIQASIDSCPVNCIHWVTKDELPALEHVMQNVMTQRVNVGVMMAGQGAQRDVFAATASFLKERKRKEEARARAAQYYSPEQERARRRAAEMIAMQYRATPFEEFFNKMFSGSTIGRNMGGAWASVSTDGDAEDLKKVGSRKRKDSARWDWIQKQKEAGGWTVPPERALVPISVYVDNY